jgi:hypothetical protein
MQVVAFDLAQVIASRNAGGAVTPAMDDRVELVSASINLRQWKRELY